MKQLISQLFQKMTVGEKQFVRASLLLHKSGYTLVKKDGKQAVKDRDIVQQCEFLINPEGIDVLIKDLMDIKKEIKSTGS